MNQGSLTAANQENEKGLKTSQSSSPVTSRPRVVIVLDSVNHMRSAKQRYGKTVEPDWDGFLQETKRAGEVTAAVAVVNKGARPALLNRLEDFGYRVARCTDAPDCDELVIAEIVRHCHVADIVVIGGGDGKYRDVATVLRQIGKRVIIAAVEGSVSQVLLAAADHFVDLPVVSLVMPRTGEGTLGVAA